MMELCSLLVLAFVLYGSSLHGGFIFDDIPGILGNDEIMRGDWKTTAFGPTASIWRSWVRLSFALNVKIFAPPFPDNREKLQIQKSIFSMHVVNIALHAVNGWIVMQIASGLGLDPSLALLCGAIFVGHPLANSAVGNISGRGVLMSATFSFLAIWAVVAGVPLLAIPTGILAFGSKEDTAILPLTLAALLWAHGSLYWPLGLVGPLIILLWRWTQIRELLTVNGDSGMTEAGFPGQLAQPIYSMTSFAETVLRYPLWMLGLYQNCDPDVKPAPKWKVWIAALLLVCPLIAFLYGAPIVKDALILTILSPLVVYWCFAMPDPLFEYRAYISLLGTALILTILASFLPIWAVTLGVAWLWLATGYRSFDWSDPVAFWVGTLRDGSSSKARPLVNAGAAYQLNRDFDTANFYYTRALKLHPGCGMALANVAKMHLDQGRIEEARVNFEQAVTVCPRYKPVWAVLAQIYTKLDDVANRERCEVMAGVK